MKVIEIRNTFWESISQSNKEYSFNKQEKHKHISRLVIVTLTDSSIYGKLKETLKILAET